MLHRSKLAEVNVPTVYEVDDFSITISQINGKRPKMTKQESRKAGGVLAKLHSKDIIHGDYTAANLLIDSEGKMWVIDFGLGYVSNDVEDKAVDVFTMLKSIEHKKEFLEGYQKVSDKYSQIENRLKVIEKRVRYAF